MIPRAAVFDIGKVLLDFDYRIAARAMAEHSTMPADEIRRVLDQSPLLLEYETGRLTTAQFFGQTRAATGFRGDLAFFQAMFADIFTPMPAIVGLHEELHRRGVPTFIFSNTNELAVAHMRRQFEFFNNFQGYIFSFEVGVMKPHARIYEAVERLTGLNGGDLLYLDDRAENYAAGLARGWQAIHHVDEQATLRAVKATGLL